MSKWNLTHQLSQPAEESSKQAGENKETSVVEVIENSIYFYSNIERDKILQLNKRLRETDNKHIAEMHIRNLKYLPPIYLYINSGGGRIFDGFSALDAIRRCKSEVITIIDGECASAATFLSVVGKKRLMMEHAFMMIHQLSSFCWGKYSDIKDEVRNLDLFMKLIKGVYVQYTKIPEKKINEILNKDLFFDARTCLKYGMVDEII